MRTFVQAGVRYEVEAQSRVKQVVSEPDGSMLGAFGATQLQ